MRAFARLLDCLVYTQSRNRKTALLGRYFRSTPDPDRGWALAALTDGIPVRLPLRRMVSDLTGRFIDPVLYQLSRDYVGDTAETVALLWPDDPVDLSRQTNAPSPSPREEGSEGSRAPLADEHGCQTQDDSRRTSPLASTGKGRGRRDKVSEKSRQLSLDFTPTPQGGGELSDGSSSVHALVDDKSRKSVAKVDTSVLTPRAGGEFSGDTLAQAVDVNIQQQDGSRPTSPLPSTDGGRGWGDVGHNSGEPAYLSLGNVIGAMASGTAAERTVRLGQFLNALDASGRWALLKLLGGAPRVGVSARLARTALAEAYGRDVSEIEEIWHALEPPYLDLFAWLDGRAERPDPGTKPVFRPVMLAHPVEEDDWPKLAPEDFVAEWKWDGIRVQISARGGDVRMFSRQGDDISPAFPEIRSAFQGHNCVVDGELLIMRDGEIAPFNDLQQRLNRKAVTAKMMAAYPPHVRLYDLLFDGQEDLRALPFSERRARLETWHARHHPPSTDVSPLVAFTTFEELNVLWSSSRAEGIEGLMLKRRDSAYQAGRIKGQWFKWKRAALTLDCVLMYAQRGSGKRSSYYSDYTFGVWQEDADGGRQLVPVGKAYSGFTDEELLLLDRWIRTNTVETFGPVRAVDPVIVFEVAFDAVHASTRHKSGVAMRFPRIHRIRWDKPAAEADTLETVLRLLSGGTEVAIDDADPPGGNS
jgi:DNA ligase-1